MSLLLRYLTRMRGRAASSRYLSTMPRRSRGGAYAGLASDKVPPKFFPNKTSSYGKASSPGKRWPSKSNEKRQPARFSRFPEANSTRPTLPPRRRLRPSPNRADRFRFRSPEGREGSSANVRAKQGAYSSRLNASKSISSKREATPAAENASKASSSPNVTSSKSTYVKSFQRAVSPSSSKPKSFSMPIRSSTELGRFEDDYIDSMEDPMLDAEPPPKEEKRKLVTRGLVPIEDTERARTVRPRPPDGQDPEQYVPESLIAESAQTASEASLKYDKEKDAVGGILCANDIEINEVEGLRTMDVPQLAHGLQRVLFSPGINWLRDPRTGIYNFEPRIRKLDDVELFDFAALPPYKTSSADAELAELAGKLKKRYRGSTSSLTSLLSQIYFCISGASGPTLKDFSSALSGLQKTFTSSAKLPAAVTLEYKKHGEEDYAIDNSAKKFEKNASSNYVLLQLGKSAEKLFTSTPDEYQDYLRINSHKLTDAEKNRAEAFHYVQSDKLLMRSQLDCSHDYLPRKTFDLKTRAVIAIRQDVANYAEASGYTIRSENGLFESFEREMYDMHRSTLLKYYFQARIGEMDGIFVAFHNTSEVFGFQYLPLEDIAKRLFGNVEMGEQAFRLCIGVLERLLDRATEAIPGESLDLILQTKMGVVTRKHSLYMFVQRKDDLEGQIATFEFTLDKYLSKQLVLGPVDFHLPEGYEVDDKDDEIDRIKRREKAPLEWSIEYMIKPLPRDEISMIEQRDKRNKIIAQLTTISRLLRPNVGMLNARERERRASLSANPEALKRYLAERQAGQALVGPTAPGQITYQKEEEEDVGNDSNEDAKKAAAGKSKFPFEDEQGAGEINIIKLDDDDSLSAAADAAEMFSENGVSDDGFIDTFSKGDSNVKWRAADETIKRLRKLAQIGRKDSLERDKNDPCIMYDHKTKA